MPEKKPISPELRAELVGLMRQLAACQGLAHVAANGIAMRRVKSEDDRDSGKLWRAMLDMQGAESGIDDAIHTLGRITGFDVIKATVICRNAKAAAANEMQWARIGH